MTLFTKFRLPQFAISCILWLTIAVILVTTPAVGQEIGWQLTLPGIIVNPNNPITSAGKIYPPTQPPANNTGLTLSIDTRWPIMEGYRPVRVTVRPTTPTTLDRSLRLTFRPESAHPDATLGAVTQDIDLPAGFTSIRATIMVPNLTSWTHFSLDTKEDGRTLTDLSIESERGSSIGNNYGYGGNSVRSGILFLSPAEILQSNGNKISSSTAVFNPGSDNLLSMTVDGSPPPASSALPTPGNVGLTPSGIMGVSPPAISSGNPYITYWVYSDGVGRRMTSVEFAPTLTGMDELPDRWIGYSGLNCIIGRVEDIDELAKKHPRQWQAIRDWLRTGGNLCIYDLKGSSGTWTKLAQLEKLLQISTPSAEQADGDSSPPTDPKKRGWSNKPSNSTRIIYSNGVPVYDRNGNVTNQTVINNPPYTGYLDRDLGFGKVVAVSTDDLTQMTKEHLTIFDLLNKTLQGRMSWSNRNGVDLNNENEDFWNFLVPGVGAAPVIEFQLLITLFVLAIGPLNYYLLRRRHRIQLIVLTVPICAALVTGCLLLYALVADGLGVKMRSRSVTLIDQSRPEVEVTTQGRLGYYAGLSPSGGLKFSGTTAVTPLDVEPNFASPANANRTVYWEPAAPTEDPGTQYLRSGWLPARQQSQLVTARAINRPKSAMALDIKESSGLVEVRNRLGTTIKLLVLCDSQQVCHIGENIEQTEAKLISATMQDAIDKLLEYNDQRHLQLPPGFQQTLPSGGSFGMRRRYSHRYYGGMSQTNVFANADLMEEAIIEALDHPMSGHYEPRTYIAVVERPPEVELGLDNVESDSGFHLILGKW